MDVAVFSSFRSATAGTTSAMLQPGRDDADVRRRPDQQWAHKQESASARFQGTLPEQKHLLDITNRGQHAGVESKGLPPKGSLTLTSKLHASAFSDPNLIDGVSRHAFADQVKGDWVDVDEQNKYDPQACSAYAQSIMQYCREAELVRRPNSRYLEQVQTDVNAKMRAILVDWLVEVSEEYKLCADTLYQAVNYMDRFLSAHRAQRSQLQLIGVVCMWLASKYEEVYPPNVGDYCYITDNTYDRDQLLEMEEVVLKKLEYELTVPTAKTFLRRMLQVCNPDELLHFLSNYLTELSLLDYTMLQYTPSAIAAAAIYLANLMLKRQPWDATLQHYSTYAPQHIAQCVLALGAVHQAVSSSQSLGSIREKYAQAKFHRVSKLSPISVTMQMFA